MVALDICPETANHKMGDLWSSFHSGPTLRGCHLLRTGGGATCCGKRGQDTPLSHRLKDQELRVSVPQTEEVQLAGDTGSLKKGDQHPEFQGMVWGISPEAGPVPPPHPLPKPSCSELPLLLSLKEL